MALKYFLFDLDGVLIDACDWHFECLNMAMEQVVGFSISRQDHETKFNGLPSQTKLKMLGVMPHHREMICAEKRRFIQNKIDMYQQDQSKIELVNYLSKIGKVACVTNSIRSSTIDMLKAIGVINYFSLLVTNEDVKNHKPNPDPYEKAMEILGAKPEETIIIEDSKFGLEAAICSHATVIWKVASASEVNLNEFKSRFGGL